MKLVLLIAISIFLIYPIYACSDNVCSYGTCDKKRYYKKHHFVV
ncbi:MAG: hypothetical protein QXK37_03050 [Candidatus Woesearchaeota archaeon]